MVAPFYDRVKVTTSTTGTGEITFGSSTSGFLDFTNVPIGKSVRYVIEDLPNWEIGVGTKSSVSTFTRTTVKETSSGSTSPISLSGNAILYISWTSDSPVDSANVLHNTFPVMAYGAFFDGIHDDQPGITAAIAAAEAEGGGIVLFPMGSGCLANTVYQPNNNVHLVGAGVPQLLHNTGGSYDVGTVLKWIGATGGTMIEVGPMQDPVAGKRKSNCDVRGILFDGNNIAGLCIQIASVAFSKFDIGYANALRCGCLITTVWLQSSNTAGSWETNDTQLNDFTINGAIQYGLTTTVAATLSSPNDTVEFSSSSGFFAGMQVRFGNSPNYYVISSISGNNVTFTSQVAVSDATSGHVISFAPQGVLATCAQNTTVPTGYNTNISGNFPACYCGNTSLNQFRRVCIVNYCGGDGFTFQFTDNNTIDYLISYVYSSSYGLVFDGGIGSMGGAYANKVSYFTGGNPIARGTTTRISPSSSNFIDKLDTGNGVQFPVIEAGATIFFNTDSNYSVNASFQSPIIYEAGWEPAQQNQSNGWTTGTNTSLTVVNNLNDHIRLATGVGNWGWQIYINGSTGALNIGTYNTLPYNTPVVLGGPIQTYNSFSVWGHTLPGSQPATPTTLAQVIAILQSYGLCS